MKIRADLGTENTLLAAMQMFFHRHEEAVESSVSFGQSIRNQVGLYFFNIFLLFRRQLLFWDYIMLRIEDLVAYYV